MRSNLTRNIILLSSWILTVVPYYTVANVEHYDINYGGDLGNAEIDFDDANHTAIITPPSGDSPTTVISFRKGMVVYSYRNECLATRFKDGENKYKEFLVSGANPARKFSTLYVVGPVPAHKLKKYLGNELYTWCEQKPTSRLSGRKPKLPSLHTEDTDFQLFVNATTDSFASEHKRTKRGAKKEKKSKRNKERKEKSKGKRGKGNKNKNKEPKTPETKALRGEAQKLNIIAPRFEFPLANVPQLLTDDLIASQSTADHVILQEEPYLSPSFVRTDDDGQRFRHYRDFYDESNSNDSGSHAPSHTNRIISLDTRPGGDRQSKISIPETIVKDGQIFYRYDADESNHASDKGQSKRSHTRDPNFMDDTAQPDKDFDYYDYPSGSTNDFYSNKNGVDAFQSPVNGDHVIDPYTTEDNLNRQHGLSNVQTHGQMGDGKRTASATALSGSGSGTQVQGNTDSDGFFLAQAHSMGHHEDASLTHVFGNQHGVLGSAMTRGHGHQSKVQVEMGAHSSSVAHVASNGGTTLLSSSVQATQVGGNARSQAYGNGASASDAQMEFNPFYHSHENNGGLRGHGLATATVTDTGSTALTSLSGKVVGGSYLGTAQSSLATSLGSSSADERTAAGGYEDFSDSQELTSENGASNENFDSIPQNGQDRENIRTGFGLRHDDLSHKNELMNPSHMIGDIMETVHQPDTEHAIIAYPASEMSIIDEGGLTGGAGEPPRESEIERAPVSEFDNIQEGHGISTGGSKAGIVGLATYSHGRVGAPPGPGELLNTPQHPSHDYRYYDNEYDSEYYDEDYRDMGFRGTTNVPFFDLGPQIDFEPLESNYENLQPMLPTQYPDERQEPPTDYIFTTPSLREYEGMDSRGATPDPPIVVHQVQGLPALPDDTPHESDETPAAHLQPQYPSRSYTTESYESYSYTTPDPVDEYDYTAHIPPAEPTRVIASQHQTWTHTQSASQTGVTSGLESYDPPHIQRETYPSEFHEDSYPSAVHEDSYPSAVHEESYPQEIHERPHPSLVHEVSPESHSSSQTRTHIFQQTHDSGSEQYQPEIIQQSMDSVPLNPGVPGSVLSLPGSQGGPEVKVMTLSSQGDSVDRSLLYQRPGTPIQPGEKIPGAPGYRVPPGFRGHVILGQDVPVNVNSRKVVQGFNTRVQVSPQNPMADEPLYASVSGPAASQHLPFSSNNPSVHVTLTGGGTQSQTMQSSVSVAQSQSGSRTSSQVQTHAAMRAQPQPVSSQSHAAMRAQPQHAYSSDRSWEYGEAVLPTKSWDSTQYGVASSQQSQRGGSCCTSSKTSSQQSQRGGSCCTSSRSSSQQSQRGGSCCSSSRTSSRQSQRGGSCCSSSRTSAPSSQQGRSCCSGSKTSTQLSQQGRSCCSSSSKCCTGSQSCCSSSARKETCQKSGMQCSDVYGPYDRSRVCKPVVITLVCCC